MKKKNDRDRRSDCTSVYNIRVSERPRRVFSLNAFRALIFFNVRGNDVKKLIGKRYSRPNRLYFIEVRSEVCE